MDAAAAAASSVFQGGGVSTSALPDLGSILSPLGSVCELACVLWKTDAAHNGRREPAVLPGEAPQEAPLFLLVCNSYCIY